MRSGRLFLAALGLSLALHAVLFVLPGFDHPQAARQPDRHRVTLVKNVALDLPVQPEAIPIEPEARERPEPVAKQAPQVSPEAIEMPSVPTAESSAKEEESPAEQDHGKVNSGAEPEQRGVVEPSLPSQAGATSYELILGDLRRLILESINYPKTARRKGIEGSVVVRLTLSTTGHAQELTVAASSGSRLLDRAALRAVEEVLPYRSHLEAPLTFEIPIAYRLDD